MQMSRDANSRSRRPVARDPSERAMSQALMRDVIAVLGMHNNGCRECVIEALESQEGVVEALVSLHRGRATVVHTRLCTADMLLRAVVAAGYAATPVTQGWPV